MISLPVVLLALATTALLAAAIGCAVGTVRSALRGQAIDSGLGLSLTVFYGVTFLVFAYLLAASL